MFLYNLADKIVFYLLKNIQYGYLEVITFKGDLLKFGNSESFHKAYITIKSPNLTFKLIKGGDIAFAECYMKGEFETNNLSDLIELMAKNINIVNKNIGRK